MKIKNISENTENTEIILTDLWNEGIHKKKININVGEKTTKIYRLLLLFCLRLIEQNQLVF